MVCLCQPWSFQIAKLKKIGNQKRTCVYEAFVLDGPRAGPWEHRAGPARAGQGLLSACFHLGAVGSPYFLSLRFPLAPSAEGTSCLCWSLDWHSHSPAREHAPESHCRRCRDSALRRDAVRSPSLCLPRFCRTFVGKGAPPSRQCQEAGMLRLPQSSLPVGYTGTAVA